MSELGWRGKKVRHTDGRQGKIVGEYTGFCHAILAIKTEGGDEATVQLNTNGPDTGETGWEWWCAEFMGKGGWLPLGDHSARDPVAT